MKTPLLIILLISIIFHAGAQDPTVRTMQAESSKSVKVISPDTSHIPWKAGGLYSLNIGQGTLSNWAAGGDDFSLTINSFLNLFAAFRNNKISWDNNLDISLGYLKTTSLGSRKNDDRFDLFSKYGYALNPKLNLSSVFDIRSQFFKGYTYPANVKTFSSAFMAPGFVLLSLGLDYKPAKDLSIFLSPFTARWVIVRNDSLSAKGSFGVDTGRHSINELGAFSTISYFKNINKHVSFKSRLDLFSNYKKNPQNIDLYMTNILSVKIAKFITFNWNVDLIYDDDVKLFGKYKTSPALQMKSIVGIGLQVRFPGKPS